MAGNVAEYSEANFESSVLQAEGTVLVDFWAPWCGPCRQIAPMIDQLAGEHPSAKIGKVNIDDNPGIASKYGITSIPTILIFNNGEVSASYVGGSIKKDVLEDAISA